jgi:hypothetical protein
MGHYGTLDREAMANSAHFGGCTHESGHRSRYLESKPPHLDDTGMPPGLRDRPVLDCSSPGPRPVAHTAGSWWHGEVPAARGAISGAAKRSHSPEPSAARDC